MATALAPSEQPASWWERLWARLTFGPMTAVVAAALALFVTLGEIGILLGRVQTSGQSYGPGVFTGFKIDFWDVEALRAAAGYEGTTGVWQSAKDVAGMLVRVHLGLDLLFAVTLCLVFAWALRSVSSTGPAYPPLSFQLPVAYLVADWVETTVTSFVLHCGFPGSGVCDFGVDGFAAGAVHVLSDVKWLLVAANLVAVVVLYLRPATDGRASWARTRVALRQRGDADTATATGPPGGVLALVLLFVALVAVPGGGALDQMPDVLRVQFDHVEAFWDSPRESWDELLTPALSTLSLLGFLLVVYLAVAGSIRPSNPTPAKNLLVVVVAAALSAVLVVLRWVLDGRSPFEVGVLPALAPLAVFAAIVGLGWFVGRVRTLASSAAPDTSDPATAPGDETSGGDPTYGTAVRSAALVVAAIVFAAGVGAIRALLPVILVAPSDSDSGLARLALALAYAVAIAGTAVAAQLVAHRLWSRSWGPHAPTPRREEVGKGLVIGAVVVTAGVFAVDPGLAGSFGATGATTVGLAALALLFWALGALTRKWRWERTEALGGGSHTSWGFLLVVVWLTASQLDLAGGYHDARTLGTPADSAPAATRTVDDALSQWQAQVPATGSTCLRGGRMPLVLVAAPGGGARAMYWTAAGMDRLFTPEGFCPQSLFAASGVSGGAVGLAATLALEPSEKATPVADRMAGEEPLAATVAALLLRDLGQPLTGIRSAWRDRAAILEDQWVEVAADPDNPDRAADEEAPDPTTFDDLGEGWWDGAGTPVILLNGTSVVDGCRAVVTNIRRIEGARRGCLDAPNTAAGTSPDSGLLSATVDLAADLAPSTGAGAPADGSPPADVCEAAKAQSLRATTAALLAARFPYVTPSGALRKCLDDDGREGTDGADPTASTTFVVDGGYLENTGLLSLLQVWQGVEDQVGACNQLATAYAATTGADAAAEASRAQVKKDVAAARCLTDDGGAPVLVEPWLVMLENHYGSAAAPPMPSRPRELLVPPATAFTKRATTFGTEALEQAAVVEVNRSLGGLPACNRFVRLSPGRRPGVEAPLGWVLSQASTTSLDDGLARSWAAAAPDGLAARC